LNDNGPKLYDMIMITDMRVRPDETVLRETAASLGERAEWSLERAIRGKCRRVAGQRIQVIADLGRR
jgi:hypothetical protein